MTFNSKPIGDEPGRPPRPMRACRSNPAEGKRHAQEPQLSAGRKTITQMQAERDRERHAALMLQVFRTFLVAATVALIGYGTARMIGWL